MKFIHRQQVVLCFFCVISNPFALGLEANLYGNLIVTPPECILNNNNQAAIHFGDILLTRIDGNNYSQTLPLNLSCTGLAKNNLTLTLEGDGTSFNSDGALKTSNNKLGVAFYINNVRQAINQPVNINYTSLPSLKAAPIKNMTAGFNDTDGGSFTALATLKVNYQ
ncbi:fimbrial protein [Providencia alcalifaciens]|uniref:fimbrial protein n=1 Tax=Providencia alcalifaciens TaxID=126385 RepID=UPI001CE050FC|nr:fimbrial protein [Providencia alcalifaciens]UBX48567.1 fimbrial protein [Providencia alcalifaciens]